MLELNGAPKVKDFILELFEHPERRNRQRRTLP
jgi:hypothetical protein